jgi:hypothetical protein
VTNLQIKSYIKFRGSIACFGSLNLLVTRADRPSRQPGRNEIDRTRNFPVLTFGEFGATMSCKGRVTIVAIELDENMLALVPRRTQAPASS